MTPPLPTITKAQERALEILREGRRFLLVGHERPDGDCVGSQVALAHVLRSMGKDVVIVNPDRPSHIYDFLFEGAPYRRWEGGELPPHDVCVLLDINELSRCGSLAEPIAAAESRKIVVDHHPPGGEAWWDAAFMDVTASATGLLIWRIARLFECPLDALAAKALFAALVTDTGWFRYSNTDAETMAAATELVAAGVVPNELYSLIYQRNPAGHPEAVAGIVGRMEYFCDGRLAVVDHPLPTRGGPSLDDSDPVLDLLRSVGLVEVVLYVRELEGGFCKLSARSKRDFDVNTLARRFGGGGHSKASGATIRGTLPEVKRLLVDAATELLDEHLAPRRADRS